MVQGRCCDQMAVDEALFLSYREGKPAHVAFTWIRRQSPLGGFNDSPRRLMQPHAAACLWTWCAASRRTTVHERTLCADFGEEDGLGRTVWTYSRCPRLHLAGLRS